MDTPPPLELVDIAKAFPVRRPLIRRLAARLRGENQSPEVRAVEDLSLSLRAGEILALVGESGCGKSTAGRIAVGTIPASRGQVRYGGAALAQLSRRGDVARRLAVQMIFQNPRDSLNPRHRIDRIIAEPALRHGFATADTIEGYVEGLLRDVGLDPAFRTRWPHELSGGQCQRVGIARALAVRPEVLVCDEPISALDVSVQAQILNLFLDLRAERGIAFLFISHDLSVVRRISDRVAVMYLGRIVELADSAALFARPRHPYTRALLAAAPRLDLRHQAYSPISGEVPSPLSPPGGCHFHPRCALAVARCRSERPALRPMGDGRQVACHLETPTSTSFQPAEEAAQ